MSPYRRLRTRVTRPVRRLIETGRLGARVWLVEDANGAAFRRRVPDRCHAVITGYRQIFSRLTIEAFRSFVNVHPSVLPYYRGPAPVQSCVADGHRRSGYTLHEVTVEIDQGPILRQGIVEIPNPECATLAIIDALIPVFREWLQRLAGRCEFQVRTVDAESVYRVCDLDRSSAVDCRR